MKTSNQLPKMIEVRQDYPRSPRLDIPAVLREQFEASGANKKILPGMRIAVGVGSRGITNLKDIVKATLELLIAEGAQPCVVPAMGSHGGGTPEGQSKVLAEYGITPETMSVPFETSMEVSRIGVALDGRDVVFSTPALKSDGVIAIGRVKPHTDFRGPLGSGIQKMLVIGFGKQIGAQNAHRAAASLGHEVVIREFASMIVRSVPPLCGVAIVEDQYHQTEELAVLTRENLVRDEERLLTRARSLLAQLPFDEIDLLIVDEIGKEISGSGMDTNVIGRDIYGHSTALHLKGSVKPHIHRIFVRDLSETTNGNGIGLGLADFTTTRAVKALDRNYTYLNALTALSLASARIPIHFDSDREVIRHALASLASETPEKLRVVQIPNTLNLDSFFVSPACVPSLRERAGVQIVSEATEMEFDAFENLVG